MIWLSSFVGQVENLRLQRLGQAVLLLVLISSLLISHLPFFDKINEPSRREKEKEKNQCLLPVPSVVL